jgi:2,3-bisphosphoglycerate-dependent phosphoglycerate mutase
MWLPVVKHWRLNERHYGALQGKDKVQAVETFGEAQVHQWRRGYATQPPLVDKNDPDYPRFDPRYRDVPEGDLPRGESLKDVSARVMPYWERDIVPLIKGKKKVLIAAHGNSLRALLKHLEGLSEPEIESVNLPTGVPKVYRLNERMLAAEARFHGDPAEIQARIQSVAHQTKKA